MNLSPESRQYKWNLIKKGGKAKFILLYGVLLWGISTAIISVIYSYLFLPNTHHIRFYIILLIIFPVLGLLWGWIQWIMFENLYRSKQDIEYYKIDFIALFVHLAIIIAIFPWAKTTPFLHVVLYFYELTICKSRLYLLNNFQIIFV